MLAELLTYHNHMTIIAFVVFLHSMEKKKVLNVDSFLKTLESTNGRDKLGKLVQYVARLSAWYLTKYNPKDKEAIARATGVQKGVASARKLTRLFKWWPLLIKLYDAFSKKGLNQSITELLRHGSALGFANYFFWDGATWAISVGLMKGDTAKYGKWSMYGWFFALAFAIVADTLDLLKIVNKPAKKEGESTNAAAVVSTSTCCGIDTAVCQKYVLNYAKNFSDLAIASKGIQIADFSEGFLGVCGIVAALVGFYELWPAQ
jgi:peroxin-11B